MSLPFNEDKRRAVFIVFELISVDTEGKLNLICADGYISISK